MTKLTNQELQLLEEIIVATNTGGFVYASLTDTSNLVYAGVVEFNSAMKSEDGKVAFRATPAANAFLAEKTDEANREGSPWSVAEAPVAAVTPFPSTVPAAFAAVASGAVTPAVQPLAERIPAMAAPAVAVAAAVAEPAEKPLVSIGSGFVPPAKKRSSLVGSRRYPFMELAAVGDYFFVGATQDEPRPARKIRSSVSKTNKDCAELQPRRYFTYYEAVAGQTFGSIVAPTDGVYVVRIEPPVAE